MKQINITDCTMSEALSQIDTLDGMSAKGKNCLRLLTEEMFAICKELMNTEQLEFIVRVVEETYTLEVATKKRLMIDTKEELLSVSSSGKNAAHKGFKGLLVAALDALTYDGDPYIYNEMVSYGMHHRMGSECAWTLSRYMETAPESEIKKEWDGMEKSIMANFADDVTIGISNGKVTMTVIKKF